MSAIACEVTRMRQRSGDGYLMRRQQIGVKQMRCVYFDAGDLTAWDVLRTEVALELLQW